MNKHEIKKIELPSGDLQLRECPFCGNKEIIFMQYETATGDRWSVFCTGCTASIDPGWAQKKYTVSDRWNRRTFDSCNIDRQNTGKELNGAKLYQDDIITWEIASGKCTGLIKFGQYEQDGSGGEYKPVPCLGWYVEVLAVAPYSWSGSTQEEVENDYPEYEKTQSLIAILNEYECKVVSIKDKLQQEAQREFGEN